MTSLIPKTPVNQNHIDLWLQDQKKPKCKRTYAWIGVKGKGESTTVVLIEKNKLIKRIKAFVQWIFGKIRQIKPKTPLLRAKKIEKIQKKPTSDLQPRLIVSPLPQPAKDLTSKFFEKQKVLQEPLFKAEDQFLGAVPSLTLPKSDEEIKKLDESLGSVKNQMQLELITHQYGQLSALLIEKFGEKRAHEIVFDSHLFPEFQNADFKPLTKQRVDRICAIAENYYFNLEAFKELKDELTQISGEDISEKILSNIKLFHSGYFDGRNKVTPDLIENAKKLAVELKDKSKAEDLVEQIKTACKRWLPVDPEMIEKQFHLSKVLETLPDETQMEMKSNLHKDLMFFMLKKRLKEPHKLVSPDLKFDSRFLKKLGILRRNAQEDEKLALIAVCKEVLEEELKRFENASFAFFSFDEYQKKLNELSYERCLTVLGIESKEELQKYRALKKAFLQKSDELLKDKKTWMAKLPEAFRKDKLPLAGKLFEDYLKRRQVNRVNDLLMAKASKELKDKIKDKNVSLSALEENCEEFFSKFTVDFQKIYEGALNILSKNSDYKFLEMYGSFFEKELVQGYELNEEGEIVDNKHSVLGNGVCWAKERNLIIMSLMSPKTSLKDLETAAKVTYSDRFKQSSYSMKAKFSKKRDESCCFADKEMLEKSGLTGGEEKELFETISLKDDEKFEEMLSRYTVKIDQYQTQLKRSCGWVNITLFGKDSAHAISVRLDELNHSFAIHDANCGLIDFSSKPALEARACVYQCLEDLLKCSYPETRTIVTSQITKGN